ncbi:hypothetical protein NEOLEDRAFT_905998 [Neolentinus lepideus HHB14362 ss-1]|uniref:NYN domain-containing protein n=1 Tax=Neolentinus lepideus HHB14362 ss-1 TaxID=1314782 RepID=A0A165UIS4_9AGAM|nr:hypothetical protein NEOLEDRAFT_905998 [Neolentinus lepideus HHB14362 ss-1]
MLSLTGNCRAMTLRDRVAIFWDYENVRAPLAISGNVLAGNIRSVAHKYGSVNLFRAYIDLSQFVSSKSAAHHSILQTPDVTLVDCPHNGRKDVADKMIIVDMLAFALDHPPPATIILISGDCDFAYAVSILRLRGYDVVLIAPKLASNSIKSVSSLVLDWDSNVMGRDTDSASSPTQSPIAPTSGAIALSQHSTGVNAEGVTPGRTANVIQVDRSPAGPGPSGNSSNDPGCRACRMKGRTFFTSSTAIPATTSTALTSIAPVVPSVTNFAMPCPKSAVASVAHVVPPVPHADPYLAFCSNLLQLPTTRATPSTPFVSAPAPAQRNALRSPLADTTANLYLPRPAGEQVPSKFKPLIKYLEKARLKGIWPVPKKIVTKEFWNRRSYNQVVTGGLESYLRAAAVADIIDRGTSKKPSKRSVALRREWHGMTL